MKRWLFKIVSLCMLLASITINAFAIQLIPGGNTVGIDLQTQGVIVVKVTSKCTADLQTGDAILSVNGTTVHSAAEIQQLLSKSVKATTLEIIRNGQHRKICIPLHDKTEQLGVYVRDHLSGIGTITYIDPANGNFGALGHGVHDMETGKLLSVAGGCIFPAKIVAVQKGQTGKPGRLEGTPMALIPDGEIQKNTPYGVFGTISANRKTQQALEVAKKEQIRTGKATILSTISGTHVQEYDVTILKIYPTDKQTGRNLLLQVTDPKLLSTTGGIVQGMSGSPILQNRKIVGAVTHVCVNL